MSDLYLKQLLLGPMENFVYLVGSRSARRCYAVDPAWDVQAVQDAAAADGMTIVGALVTHYHPDHCGGHLWGHDIEGVAELATAAKVPVYAHADEVEGVAAVTGLSRSDLKACRSGDKLPLGEAGGLELTAIHTPGHTPGSQCFLCAGRLISGDTLFLSGCGRVDLPGGNKEQLFESLSTKLATLPPDTVLYPGHNYDDAPHAALSDVRRRNPYLQASTLAEWGRLFR
jgi:glyoxylase-like metal-dependent hydrolase (beta-lactamase superfamily II)